MPTKEERNRAEKEAEETKRRLINQQRSKKFLNTAKKTKLGNMVGKRTDAIDAAFKENF
tara:strand:+ start:1277 stop:1453 length:177 start_codon:yes stop_codon:yes gene_type:complete